MAEKLWNITIYKFLSFRPKCNFRKTLNLEKSRRTKIYFSRIVQKHLQSLKTYHYRNELIQVIQSFNWNSLPHKWGIHCWYINALIDTILELGVDVSKIRLYNYMNKSYGFFYYLGIQTSYFNTSNYDILWKRLNYFRTIIIGDLDSDVHPKYIFYTSPIILKIFLRNIFKNGN